MKCDNNAVKLKLFLQTFAFFGGMFKRATFFLQPPHHKFKACFTSLHTLNKIQPVSWESRKGRKGKNYFYKHTTEPFKLKTKNTSFTKRRESAMSSLLPI